MQLEDQGRRTGRRLIALLALGIAWIFVLSVTGNQVRAQGDPNSNVRPPANAVTPAQPGTIAPSTGEPRPGHYDPEMWRNVRKGLQGQVSIPDKKAGTLVQSGGEIWRNTRNGPLSRYGAYALAGMLALLIGFYLVRGKVRVEHGFSGFHLVRFDTIERVGHWLMATSFIILALSGLNVLYGRYVVRPLLGEALFADVTMWGKWLHNHVALAFAVGLLISFVRWVRHNFLDVTDIVWIAKGGGILVKGVHPAAKKFNFGQKVIFWLVMLCGVSLLVSGLSLLFPFQFGLFAKTFGAINWMAQLAHYNPGLPTALTPVEEMQYATLWHAILALAMSCVILAHIYIGTIGMEGAFSAMGTGEVDVNWAKEHHSIWAEQALRSQDGSSSGTAPPRPAPAE